MAQPSFPPPPSQGQHFPRMFSSPSKIWGNADNVRFSSPQTCKYVYLMVYPFDITRSQLVRCTRLTPNVLIYRFPSTSPRLSGIPTTASITGVSTTTGITRLPATELQLRSSSIISLLDSPSIPRSSSSPEQPSINDKPSPALRCRWRRFGRAPSCHGGRSAER